MCKAFQYKYFCLNEGNIMNATKHIGVNHYLQEDLAWERALDFYLQENAFLKTRLSLVLDNTMDSNFIAKAEYFQNGFIHNDDCIKDLKSDVIYLQRSLKDFIAGKYGDEKKLTIKYNKLHNEMGHFDKQFLALKSEFNQYLLSFI